MNNVCFPSGLENATQMHLQSSRKEATLRKLLIVCAALCMAVSMADARSRKSDRECKARVKVSGDAAIRISKAKKNAARAWRQRVIETHGERFAELALARRVKRRCRTVRVGGSMRSLRLQRCSIVARPCSLRP